MAFANGSAKLKGLCLEIRHYRQAAIQEGIDSGINENFDADEFLNELKARKQNNG